MLFNKKAIPNSETKNKYLIVVDPGKHTTKSIILPGHFTTSFRTKMFDNTQEMDAHGKSYSIVFEGKKYIIGEQAEEMSFDVSKTNLLHKLVVYTAISELAENDSIIQLVINCPVSIYKNKSLRDEYKNFILNNGEFSITVNGQQFNYEFENILVLPEDYGVVYKYPNLFKGNRVALIGLGGLNMNFMIVNNIAPEISTMFTVNHGGNELETNIVNELNSRFALNIDHKNAPYILDNKGLKIKGKIDKESTEIVQRVINEFISNIIKETEKNGHKLDMLDVVFVGGTSVSIQEEIEDRIKHVTVVSDAQWAAVEGSLKVGEIKYGETKKSNIN